MRCRAAGADRRASTAHQLWSQICNPGAGRHHSHCTASSYLHRSLCCISKPGANRKTFCKRLTKVSPNNHCCDAASGFRKWEGGVQRVCGRPAVCIVNEIDGGGGWTDVTLPPWRHSTAGNLATLQPPAIRMANI